MVHLFNPLLHVPFLSFCSPLLRPNRHIHVHTNTHHTEGAQQLKWAEIKETLGISNGSKWPYSGDSVESTSIHYLCICFYLTLHEHVLGNTHTRALHKRKHTGRYTHTVKCLTLAAGPLESRTPLLSYTLTFYYPVSSSVPFRGTRIATEQLLAGAAGSGQRETHYPVLNRKCLLK